MPKMTSEDTKQIAVAALNSGVSPAELCEQLRISRSTLYKWKQDYTITTLTESSSRELYLLKQKVSKLEYENSLYRLIISTLSLNIDTMVHVVDEIKGQYSLYSICRLLGLNKSTYINRVKSITTPKQHDIEDATLGEKIAIIFQKSNYRFGTRKIRAKLLEDGYAVSERRISRLMKERNLKPQKPLPINATFQRRYLSTPNLVNRSFDTSAPNLIWVSDITFVRVNNSTAYLCVILDLFSRKVLSYAISELIEAAFVISAFQKAYLSRGNPHGLTFHSDQGSQYTAYSFRELLATYHVRQSLSAPGCPTDNAVAESFFSSIKKDLFRFNFYETISDMEESVSEYIAYYNDFRPHQKLQQKTPCQYETDYWENKKGADNISTCPI